MSRLLCSFALLSLFVLGLPVRAAEDMDKQVGDLEKEIKALKEKLRSSGGPAAGPACTGMLGDKDPRMYGPNALVKTKDGRLTITGLVQVWYYSIQNQKFGLYGQGLNPGVTDLNDGKDNDGFKIRRTEIQFNLDITEHIQSVVRIDPAREITSDPAFNSNLGTAFRTPVTTNVTASPSTSSFTPLMLMDCYITVHDLIPYHTLYAGQMLPQIGYEGKDSNGKLDFVERAMATQLIGSRDLGMTAKGEFYDKRIAYTAAIFNSAGTHVTGGQYQNRADTNDDKDFVGAVIARPVWNDDTWGSLEMSYGGSIGTHGEDYNHHVPSSLGVKESTAWRQVWYAHYFPGGPAKGLWLKTEWVYIHDRFTGVPRVNSDGTLFVNPAIKVLTTSGAQTLVPAAVGTLSTSDPAHMLRPYTIDGWHASIGYRFDRGQKTSGMWDWRNCEVAYRFDTMENILVMDVKHPDRTRMTGLHTNIHTAGLNYYMKGHNARMQFNYNWVDEDTSGRYKMREVRNNNFLACFQVMF